MVWQVVTGETRWYIVGAYIAPADEGTMEMVVKAIRRRPPGAELLVAGDLNADILAPEGRRAESIATDLATEGLEDTKCPGQLILGNTVDYKKVCRLQSGEYVQVHQEDEP